MVLSTVFLSLVLVAVLGVYLSATRVDRSVWLLAGLAFVLRTGFAVVNQSLDLIRPADESGYHATLTFVAQQWHSGVIVAPLTVGSGPGFGGSFATVYSLVLGHVYTMFGSEMIHARLTMALFGTLVVVNLYLIASQIHSHRGGLYAAAIAAFFPYWVYLSGILYRDMVVVFFFTLVFYGLVRIQQDSTDIPAAGLVAVCGLLALGLRLENVVAIGATTAAFVYTRAGKQHQRWSHFTVVAVGSLVLLIVLFGETISVQGLAEKRLWLARENSAAYLTGFAYESFLELLAFLPIGALYFTFVPFPWQTPNTLAVLALSQNIALWYPLAIFAVLGVRDAVHSQFGWRQTLPLLAFAGAGLVGYGLVEGNIGPAMRHRSQFQFVFFLFAGIALARRLQIRSGVTGDQPR